MEISTKQRDELEWFVQAYTDTVVFDTIENPVDIEVEAAAGKLLHAQLSSWLGRNRASEPAEPPAPDPSHSLVGPWLYGAVYPNSDDVRQFDGTGAMAARIWQLLDGQWKWELFNKTTGERETRAQAKDSADAALSIAFTAGYHLEPWVREGTTVAFRKARTVVGKANAVVVEFSNGGWMEYIANGPLRSYDRRFDYLLALGYGAANVAPETMDEAMAKADARAQDNGWVAADWHPGVPTFRRTIEVLSQAARPQYTHAYTRPEPTPEEKRLLEARYVWDAAIATAPGKDVHVHYALHTKDGRYVVGEGALSTMFPFIRLDGAWYRVTGKRLLERTSNRRYEIDIEPAEIAAPDGESTC